MKKEQVNYYIGLDIGTNSVGWCLMDEQYHIIKKGNKNLWGSRLFDSAQTAQERRTNRSTRRLYNRRRERIRLLREIMNDMVLEKDPAFFIKLSQVSFLDNEDKKNVLKDNYRSNYNLFTDKNYTDYDYYHRFPTIYHLRDYLCNCEEKEDPRLIYLALHHIIKYRGNFLYEDQDFSLEIVNYEKDLKELIEQILELNNMAYNNDDVLLDIAKELKSKQSRKRKVENCLHILNVKGKEKDVYKNFLQAILGLKFNVLKLFGDEQLRDESGEKPKDIELNFSDENYDEILDDHFDILEDYVSNLQKMKMIYSNLILGDILSGQKTLSRAMIERYKNHKEELKLLKQIIKENYGLKTYNDVFRNDSIAGNYYSYIHHPNKTTTDVFYAYLKKILTGKENEKEILEKIECEQFLLKQNDRNNGNIPYQLNLFEMEQILDNQSQFYPCLAKRKNDILKILTFRIPYYYGPFQSETFGWLVKKNGQENTRILPWNHQEVVDIDETAKQFINRLTNYCTYLLDEKVMPKKSLSCQLFEVYNEINKIRVNGELLSIDVKNQIVEDLFKNKKKVKEKDLIHWFKMNHTFLNNDHLEIKGYQKDKEFSTSLSSWIDFQKILGEITENNYQMIESIIEDITIFNEKSILKRKLKKDYGLDQNTISKILKLNYSGWSRLSSQLIEGIYCDNRFGSSATILDVLKDSHLNLMEIINDKTLGYVQAIDKYNSHFDAGKITYQDIEHLACSPSVKRGIWQSLKIVDELVRYMGHNPLHIYMEFAREEGKKQRTISQVKYLQNIYNDLLIQTAHDRIVKKQLDEKDPHSAIDNERLYLYFTQKGRCMYSGKELDIDRLSFYQIDHIIPRTLTTDDSLDNKVLVLSNENQRKLDDLVVPSQIREKQFMFWKQLLDDKLISQKKFYNLTRAEFREDQIEKFINRQLVETRQIIKNVASLLQNYYPGTKVNPIRANLTHEFRVKYDIYKNRNVNNYHHAHDAYIVCILGTYINKRYPRLEAKYTYGDYIKKAKKKANSHEKSGFILNSMNYEYIDEDTGEVIWKPEMIENIKKCFQYKDCFITKKLEESSSEFYKSTIYSPNDKKEKPTIPVNSMRSNVSKYGGYTGVQYAMFAVEGKKCDKKKTLIRKIVGVPVVYKNKDIAFKKEYIEKENKLEDVNIICKVKKNQLIELDGGLYYMTSPSELVNARELLLDMNQQKIISTINKAISRQIFTEIDDSQLNEIYDCLISKINQFYPKYNSIAKKLLDLKEQYTQISIEEKCHVINQILVTLSTNPSNGNITFKDFNISNRIGRLNGQNIDLNKTTFIETSVTGIYFKKKKL